MTAGPLPTPSILRPSTVLEGKYEIGPILGRGGTATVYEAKNVQIGRVFALKVLDVSRSSGDASARLLMEARAAVQLTSEHVVRIFDIGMTESQQPYVVMEKLIGHDLARVLESRGALPLEEAVGLVLQAIHGVAEAHRMGVIHRDLKPSNLFLTKRSDGTPLLKVLDFGLARNVADVRSPEKSGEVLRGAGSPGYASPEQLGAQLEVDERADIWALGVVLYELVTGECPFEVKSLRGSLVASLSRSAPPMASPKGPVPQAFDAIVRRCIAKDREDRFASVVDLAVALGPYASSQSAVYVQRIREIATIPSTVAEADTTMRVLVDHEEGPNSDSNVHILPDAADLPIAPPPQLPENAMMFAEVMPAQMGTRTFVLLIGLGVLTFILMVRLVNSASARPIAVVTPAASATSPMLLDELPPSPPRAMELPASKPDVSPRAADAMHSVRPQPRVTPVRSAAAPISVASPTPVPTPTQAPDPMTYR